MFPTCFPHAFHLPSTCFPTADAAYHFAQSSPAENSGRAFPKLGPYKDQLRGSIVAIRVFPLRTSLMHDASATGFCFAPRSETSPLALEERWIFCKWANRCNRSRFTEFYHFFSGEFVTLATLRSLHKSEQVIRLGSLVRNRWPTSAQTPRGRYSEPLNFQRLSSPSRSVILIQQSPCFALTCLEHLLVQLSICHYSVPWQCCNKMKDLA